MLEITNKSRFPVPLMVRSRRTPRSFTTLNIPGVGRGKNVCFIEDELWTEYIERAEKQGLITYRRIPNTLRKGE